MFYFRDRIEGIVIIILCNSSTLCIYDIRFLGLREKKELLREKKKNINSKEIRINIEPILQLKNLEEYTLIC